MPVTIFTTVTLRFPGFVSSLAKSKYLCLFSLSLIFSVGSAGTAKSTIRQVLFFLSFFIIIRYSLMAEIRGSICISKSQTILCIPFTRMDSGLCKTPLVVRSNFNFLHNSQLITLPTQWYLDLHSFCVNLLHSLTTWLIVSSLLPHNLAYYLFSLKVICP